jgi:predicted permease
MSWPAKIIYSMRSLFARRKLDEQLAEEVRTHVAMATEANLAKGMSPYEARYAALREFGNVAGMQEQARAERGWVWLEQGWKDLGFALRSLRHSPGFTTVAIISLTLGIGANTAVFSLVNGILLRSLPVPNPHELRVLKWVGSDLKMDSAGYYDRVPGPTTAAAPAISDWRRGRAVSEAVSPALFQRLREAAAGQAEIFGYARINGVNARADGLAFTSQGLLVSGNFFPALGVRLALGRGLQPEDDLPGAPRAVVIGHEWWMRQFGGDPSVVGQTVMLNEVAFTVVGVSRPEFHGVHEGDTAEFFAPLAAATEIEPIYRVMGKQKPFWWISTMARLKPGATATTLAAVLARPFAGEAGAVMADPELLIEDGRAGPDWERSDYRRPLGLALAVVGIVMLAACANLAGLALARGAARQHEFAIRAALGAGRWRLLRVSLLENLVLAAAGATLGVLLARGLRTYLATLTAGADEGFRYDTSVDGRVMGFALLLAFLTALLSGILPGWRAAHTDPLVGLKSGGSVGGTRLRLGRSLVAVQLAFAALLLVGAALYGRSLLGLLRNIDDRAVENRVVFRVKARVSRPSAPINAFHDRVREALLKLPGSEAAAVMNFKPLLGTSGRVDFVTRPGPAGDEAITPAARRVVGDSFFAAMGISILEGRAFLPSDEPTSGSTVAVVNETFVRTYFPGQRVIGRTIRTASNQNWQIVGVCRDAVLARVHEPVAPTVFTCFRQSAQQSAYHVVRSSLPAPVLMQAVREAVASVDPEIAPAGMATLAEVRTKSLRRENLLATLVGTLGMLALLLASVGVCGLMGFAVTRRTREIGVRMALGAQPGSVGGMVLREAAGLAGIGVAVGLGGALALGRLMESQLHGVSARDPLSLIVAGGSLVIATVFAAAWPAWRAARVNPLIALRAE